MDVRMEGELQMKRDIDERLLRWSDNPRHLPLVLCGARQVGKTYALRELGRSHYDACAYVNLMNKPSQAVFEAGYDARTTLENIEVLTGVKIVPRKTLVIIDEIQEVPAALTLMKAFAEDVPDCHIAAAGSYLGLAYHAGESFPVGKSIPSTCIR